MYKIACERFFFIIWETGTLTFGVLKNMEVSMKSGYGTRRFMTLLLSVAMLLSTMNMSLLAVYADDSDTAAAEAAQMVEEQPGAEEAADAVFGEEAAGTEYEEYAPGDADGDYSGYIDESETSENEIGGVVDETDNADPHPVFEQSEEIDGVTVKVTAEEGAFPKGAHLVVRSATAAEEKKADKLVDKVRDTDRNIASSYTMDISVVDEDGNELQPADGKTVQVAFKADEMKEDLLEPEIYHIDESGWRDKAEALEVEVVKEKKKTRKILNLMQAKKTLRY